MSDQYSLLANRERPGPGARRHPIHPRPSVAVVLPALNEAQTVAATISAFHGAMPDALLVVVDNGSTDGTGGLALDAFAAIGTPGVLLSEPRRGKALAVRRAFHEIQADIYVLADADMTYPAGRIHDLVRPIVDGAADMVVGDRLASGRYADENKRRFHGVGNRLVLRIVNGLFHAQLGDIMSGFRALNEHFVVNYPIMVDGFQLEVDMTLHALDKRFRILEIPIEYKDRPSGSFSKLSTFADGRRVLGAIVGVVRYYRPMLFFGAMGLASAFAGLVAATPVMVDWLRYRFIYHVPLAILATGLEIVAVMSLGIGFVLDSVVHLERMSYERELLASHDNLSSRQPERRPHPRMETDDGAVVVKPPARDDRQATHITRDTTRR